MRSKHKGAVSKPGGHWEDEFGASTMYSVLFRINGFVCFSCHLL